MSRTLTSDSVSIDRGVGGDTGAGSGGRTGADIDGTTNENDGTNNGGGGGYRTLDSYFRKAIAATIGHDSVPLIWLLLSFTAMLTFLLSVTVCAIMLEPYEKCDDPINRLRALADTNEAHSTNLKRAKRIQRVDRYVRDQMNDTMYLH